MWIVGSGLLFLYITTWVAMIILGVDQGMQIALMTISLVGTAIGGATGFYFGQKSAEQGSEDSGVTVTDPSIVNVVPRESVETRSISVGPEEDS